MKNILLGFGVLITVFIIFISMVAGYVSYNNRGKGSKEVILRSNGNPTDKALIVYQPTGASEDVANAIAKGLNDEGYEVTLNYPGEHMDTDVSQYSVVVFGTSVYAKQPSEKITNYMKKVKGISGDTKVVVYSTGLLEDTAELDIMEQSLNGKQVYRKIKLLSNKKKESNSIAYDLGRALGKK